MKITQKKIRSKIVVTLKIIVDCYEKTSFLQEVYALSALSVGSENPYIVRYYSGWIEDSKLFIVVSALHSLIYSYRWSFARTL